MPFRAARDASVFALWNLIIRPPRREYSDSSLGPRKFKLHGNGGRRFSRDVTDFWYGKGCSLGITCQREDFTVTSVRGHSLKCSLFVPRGLRADDVSYPCVIYMHGNAGCRLEALPLVSTLAGDRTGVGRSIGVVSERVAVLKYPYHTFVTS